MPSALPGEQARPVGQQPVVAAGARRTTLVEQLQVARVDRHGLVRAGTDQVTVTDVVGPRRAAVGLTGERVALGGGLRGPRTVQAGRGERAEVAALTADRL